ncbi:hypothetical protein [Nostoc sp.]|uniref:hypothetical protein n=1 Tax=Nostoc sp. TaxID=1180 RepID=UPI003FA5418A
MNLIQGQTIGGCYQIITQLAQGEFGKPFLDPHQHNVIYRDIKLANIRQRTSDNKIVLIDFGAVKQISTQMPNS